MTVRSGVARRAVVLSIALACIGCQDDPAPTRSATGAGGSGASDQSFDEAMRIVCDAPDKAEVSDSVGEANRSMVLAMWIDARVRNPEVRKLMSSVAAREGNQGKIAALESGAQRAGIAPCKLAELWRSVAGGAPQAGASDAGVAAAALPSEPQTYDEAIAILCDAARRANLPARPADPGADDAAIAHQVTTEISNADVRQLFDSLRGSAPGERVKPLREAARKSGVAACALADRWAERQK